MKLFIASDIHGDISTARAVADAYKSSGADRLVLLGDLLYHGPRNDLPIGYAPKRVIELLNSVSDELLCVRGNCDTEVDAMVLSFPIMADYGFISNGGIRAYITHGHKFDRSNPPPMKEGEVLIHGHTHVSGAWEFGKGNLCLNPGSVSIPKEETPAGFIIWEDREFKFYAIDETEPYKSVRI